MLTIGGKNMDKAILTSYIVLIVAPIGIYFGLSEALNNAIAGAIAGLIMLCICILNEKNPSDVLSGTEDTEEAEDDADEL